MSDVPEQAPPVEGPPESPAPGWFRWYHAPILLLLLLALFLELRNLYRGAPRDSTVALGYFIGLLTTATAYLLRHRLKAWGRPGEGGDRRRFILIGSLGAAWAETCFWAAERYIGAHGVAASPNLLVDLMVTMPWYVSMIAVLWPVQSICQFHWTTLALLGGIYEIGADGVVGHMMGGKGFGPAWLVLIVLGYGIFVGVYSQMVLPAVWAVPPPPTAKRPAPFKRTILALAPLLPLIPYTLIMLALFAHR